MLCYVLYCSSLLADQGGHAETPNYRQVCMGTTAHAEACRIQFDPSKGKTHNLQ